MSTLEYVREAAAAAAAAAAAPATLQLISTRPGGAPQAGRRAAAVRSARTAALFDSDEPQMAALAGGAVLLRPGVVKPLLSAGSGRLRLFLDAPLAAAAPAADARAFVVAKRAPRNVLLLSGCAGVGKSHVLRELAARAASACANVRVVFVAGLQAAGDAWRQLAVLEAAVRAALAPDADSALGVAGSPGDAAARHPLAAARLLLDRASRLCRAQTPRPGEPPLRILFCLDHHEPAAGFGADVARAIASHADVFFLALAPRGNRRVPDFGRCAVRIPMQFSEAEARAIIAHYASTVFDERAQESMRGYHEPMLELVAQATWFHPGDMDLLFRRVVAGSSDFADVERRAQAFATMFDDLEAECEKPQLQRSYLRPVLDEAAQRYATAVFRVFFGLAFSGTDVSSPDGADWGGVAEPSPHFDAVRAGERGRGSPAAMEFASPRRASFVFRGLAAGDTARVFAGVSRHLRLGAQARYEMAYACVLWMLRHQLRGFPWPGPTDARRVRACAPATREALRLASLRPFPAPARCFYSNAAADGCANSMAGLDFVALRHCAGGVAPIVLAMEAEGVDIDFVMDCALDLAEDDLAEDDLARLPNPLSPDERALAGIAEACRVARHMGAAPVTVYLATTDRAFRNATNRCASLARLNARLELVSITT
ncbi:hypothetical protein GGI04_004336, partial [Coemansia thaxteri]